MSAGTPAYMHTHIVMAHVVMACMATACIVMACIGMALQIYGNRLGSADNGGHAALSDPPFARVARVAFALGMDAAHA